MATVTGRHGSRRAALAVFIIAVLVRVAVLAVNRGELFSTTFSDERSFHSLATGLATGKGLAFPSRWLVTPDDAPEKAKTAPIAPEVAREQNKKQKGEAVGPWASDHFFGVIKPGAPTSFYPPAYPVLLSLVYRAFGQEMLPARMLGILLVSASCALTYVLMRRFTGQLPALLMALFLAAYPPWVFYSITLQTEALFIFLVTAAVWLYLRALESKHALAWCAAVGAASGLAFLTRPIGAAIALAFLASWLFQMRGRKPLPGAVAQIVALLIVITPWVARNRAVQGEWVVLPTQGGYNGWVYSVYCFAPDVPDILVPISEQQRYRSLLRVLQHGQLARADLLEWPAFTNETEVQRDRVLQERVVEFQRANPRLAAGLITYRTMQLLGLVPGRHREGNASGLAILAAVTAGSVLMVLGWAGILVARRRHDRALFPMYVVLFVYLGAAALTMGGARARLPVDGCFALFAALLIERVLRRPGHSPAAT